MKNKKVIGITGAKGALGKSLTKIFQDKGYQIIGFTHTKVDNDFGKNGSNEWIYWECGKEYLLEDPLKNVDILILNHGIYPQNLKNPEFEKVLNINALSQFRIFHIFKEIALNNENQISPKEIWINTSEAEILPALNPCYEISKSLIGQVVTFKRNFDNQNESRNLIIKKIILGPFKSDLNPIGVMSPESVASLIFYVSKISNYLIIISPNPITYILFPLREFYFFVYFQLLNFFKKRS